MAYSYFFRLILQWNSLPAVVSHAVLCGGRAFSANHNIVLQNGQEKENSPQNHFQ